MAECEAGLVRTQGLGTGCFATLTDAGPLPVYGTSSGAQRLLWKAP